MNNFSTSNPHSTGIPFQTRRNEVASILALILSEGRQEGHETSTAYCAHFKQRRGYVAGEQAQCQVFQHAAGTAIRFWVYGLDFSIKVRDLVIITGDDKGTELWLEADGKLFPHEGKYALAARQIVSNILQGK